MYSELEYTDVVDSNGRLNPRFQQDAFWDPRSPGEREKQEKKGWRGRSKRSSKPSSTPPIETIPETLEMNNVEQSIIEYLRTCNGRKVTTKVIARAVGISREEVSACIRNLRERLKDSK